jgi:hypothetical protein
LPFVPPIQTSDEEVPQIARMFEIPALTGLHDVPL